MTSHTTSLSPKTAGTDQPRAPLRLRLSESPGRAALDGGWWPRTRDIDVELADLVDRFPVETGRVSRALYSRPDWDTQPRSVRVARGLLKTGSFPRDDAHVMVLSMSTRTWLRLLVVPPDQLEGEQALRLAADPSNRSSASDILAALRDSDAATEASDAATEAHEQWADDGGRS